MAEERLTGKLKTSRFNLIKIFAIALAFLLCLPFMMFSKNNQVAFAETTEISNQQGLVINSTAGSSRVQNDCLVKKGTNEFYDGFVYLAQNSNGNNADMVFSTSQTDFGDQKSFFVWVFIPSLIVQDLVVELSDGSNSIVWRLSGTEISDNVSYNLSLIDAITNYNGKLSKGWKLLELNKNDAVKKQESSLEIISSIKISYGFLIDSETQDDAEFAVCYPFVADKTGEESQVVLHQDYVVYAEKESFLSGTSSVYVDDKIKFSSAKDFFEYAIIGKQNVLNNLSGYVWNIMLTSPSGTAQTLTFDKKIEIEFSSAGYYLLDIMLTTIDQDYYPLISEAVSIYAEPFAFGYFQKTSYNFVLESKNLIVLTLSQDFTLDTGTEMLVSVGDKNIADATYYIENDKVYITIDAKELGNTTLSVSASGLKTGNTEAQTYELVAQLTVVNAEQSASNVAIWVIFGVLMTGFVTYLVISFVKSRRFGVK